jgi:hypothetical protein
LQAHPNPFTHNTVVEFVDGKPPTLKIYDLGGRLVRNLQINKSPQPEAHPPRAENQQISKSYWDGTDNAGKRLPRGIYLYRLNTGDYAGTKKLLML